MLSNDQITMVSNDQEADQIIDFNNEIMKKDYVSDVKEILLGSDGSISGSSVVESDGESRSRTSSVSISVSEEEDMSDELNEQEQPLEQAVEQPLSYSSLSPNSSSPHLDVASVSSASPGIIDWESLTDIEMNLITEDDCLELLYTRRDFLLVQDDEYDEGEDDNGDSDGNGNATKNVLLPHDVREILIDAEEDNNINQTTPWKDIPNLNTLDPYCYSDNELLLWSAIISDYRKTSVKCPKYTSTLVYSGIPPALRGEAWKSMSNAHSPTLHSLYNSLANESTHFAKIIGRDLNRTFPEITLFRDKNGQGQHMLGKVMRAYSAYDIQVGYCQGLTFLVGPLLLHMNDCDAFCVMVRLMEDYELRSMFTVNMAGVTMRMYQFDYLLAEILPELHNHFNKFEISTIYASQWFLSMFAVTCPLSMLVRIYDLIFCEGAINTLMRTSLAILKRNQAQLLEFDDEEPILELLLGKSLWDVYNNDADLLINDITSIDQSAVLNGLEISEQAYNSMGKLERARSRKRGKLLGIKGKNNTSISSSKSRPVSSSTITNKPSRFFSGLPWSNSWSLTPLTEAISESTSIHSSDEESIEAELDTTHSHSPSLFPTPQSESHQSVINLQNSLQIEQNERQIDKDTIQSLLAEIPNDILQSNPKLQSISSELCQRLRISNINITSNPSPTCSTCDRLLMDLATAKTNEALARQEVDLLQDELINLKSQSTTSPTPSTPQKTIRHSPSKWNLW